MNIFKIITALPPSISIEGYHQSQPNYDPAKGNKSYQNIEEKHESQEFKIIPKTSADLPKGASQKIDIDKVNKQIKQSKKGVKDKKKAEEGKEEIEKENE